jgi:hypothetical protein
MSPSSTETPLVYCIPYPSSTPTAFQTPTSTPLVLITPWPTNGSATASTSPFFMMIPYPSLSPLPILINGTATTDSFDLTAMIVTGVAVGTMGIGSVALLFQYINPPQKAKEAKQEANQEEIQKEIQITEVNMPDPLTYLCINTADLEDVTFLLTTFRKRFQVLSPNLTIVQRGK